LWPTEFDWDSGNWPKCGKHGVGRNEIEGIFSRTISVVPAPDKMKNEERFIAVGTNEAGRAVLVVFTLRKHAGRQLLRPVSARYIHEKERRHHEEQTSRVEKAPRIPE
jgi:uncharacterized DUF497 family protein